MTRWDGRPHPLSPSSKKHERGNLLANVLQRITGRRHVSAPTEHSALAGADPRVGPRMARLTVQLKQKILTGIVLLLLAISACTPQQGSAPLLQSTVGIPPMPLSLQDAQRTAADFLNYWEQGAYDAMYSLLTVNSRDSYSRQDFEQFYSDAEKTMTLLPGGKSYELKGLIQLPQSANAALSYNATFKTRLFGDFTDSPRTLNMISTADGWRVAWSQDDIFAGMKDGGYLDVTQTAPNRGNIYDRDGQVIADQNGVAVEITLLTKSYPGSPEACFAELAHLFPSRSADKLKQLYGGRTGQNFAFVVGELAQESFTAERANLEKVCKLSYQTRPTRRYVAGSLAPHVIGYVGRIPAENQDYWLSRGYSPASLVGLDGIERYWESTLAGQSESTLTLHIPGQEDRQLADRPAKPSQSVYVSLDRKLQQAVQDALADTFSKAPWGAYSTGAAAVVMDVHTGEILAIASYPDFNVDAFNPYSALKDPQQLIDAWSKDARKPTFSRATLGIYPPGSVFKIIAMAAATDSGKFALTSPYTCTGTWDGAPLGDTLRRDWIFYTQVGQHGTITLKQALTGSCDTYFWHVGWTLNSADPHILVNYAHMMGLGAPTGIQDVAEAAGTLPDPDTYVSADGIKWRGSDALNTVIGQGEVQATPLQIARMVAAVANDGTLYQPLLVDKVGLIGQPSYVAKPTANGHLNFKPGVLAGIRSAMCDVTTNQTLGTAEFIFHDFKGAAVCGKTGTAQVGLSGELPDAWFAAFAGKTPNKPDISVVVIVEHSNEGSYVAAPLVRRIVEAYYDLPLSLGWFQGGLPTIRNSD